MNQIAAQPPTSSPLPQNESFQEPPPCNERRKRWPRFTKSLRTLLLAPLRFLFRVRHPVARIVRRIVPDRSLDFLQAFIARHPLLIALYYVWNGAFLREQTATFHGRYCHVAATDSKNDDAVRYSLRRSIHRLEKALIMRNRRDVFAKDYIIQAVQDFEYVVQRESEIGAASDPLVAWAGDVLERYFAVVGSSHVTDRARSMYSSISQQYPRKVGELSPYLRESTPLQIKYEDLHQLALRRRSVRWYQQRPVPREIIDNAIDVARWSPSACNRQPFEFRIYDEPDFVQRIATIPMGTQNFAENFPCIIVLVGHMRAFPYERDRHVIYIDAALSAMAFQYALEVQGVSSCCINWPDIEELEQRMAETLNLRSDERVVMLISLGYPDPEGLVPRSEKKSLDEIRVYNKPLEGN